VGDLLEMHFRELVELLGAEGCQRDADDAPARWIGIAPHQAVACGAVDQSHDTVVAEHKVVGDLADRRAAGVGVALDRQ
jgi:hypothetical protein